MLTLPDVIIPLHQPFKVMFQARTWSKAQVLLIGAILATRKRTVTSALRVMGLSDDTSFARYHHVLNRAGWSPLRMAHCLLLLLVQHLDHSDGPLVFGIDETLERRRGRRIKAKGIYRDGVRSSASHFVKASGLRWVSLMWLAPIPWAHRTWALPVLTALASSERYYQEMGRTHKKLTDWARRMIAQLRLWLPHRTLVIVADSSYAVLDLLHFCQSMTRPVTFITRLRLDAALYEPAPPRLPGHMGRPRLKGQRLPTLKQLLDQPATPWTAVMVPWYDGTLRRVENASHTAVWYHKGKAPVPIRWVLIRDPMGAFRPQALLCTDLNSSPLESSNGSCCDGSWRSPRIQYGAGSSRKFALTWEWKLSANGLTWPSPAPHRRSSGCSHGLHWQHMHWAGAKPYPSAQQLGITRPCPPSPMLSLWSAITCGSTQTFSAYPLLNPTSENSLPP